MALERLAQLSVGSAAQRARIDAAGAYADAGERAAVERMLQQIATAGGAGSGSRAAAVATLIAVTVESGRVEEAEARLRDWKDRLTAGDAASLRQQLSRAWVGKGELDRAEAVLGDDSTVTVLAARGWIALYRGSIRVATDFFRGAGPRAGSRKEVTERTAVLALLQSITPDSVPLLGAALLQLARGDTATALQALHEAAAALPPRGGRAERGLAARGTAAPRRGARHRAAVARAALRGAPPGQPGRRFFMGGCELERLRCRLPGRSPGP